MKEKVMAIIDSSSLIKLIEGKEMTHNKLKISIKDVKLLTDKMEFSTITSCLLNAIWKADSETKLQNVQEIMAILDIAPSMSDYKNEEEVKSDVIAYARALSMTPEQREETIRKFIDGVDKK